MFVKVESALKRDKKVLSVGDKGNHVFGSRDTVSRDEEKENLGKTVTFD